MALELSGGSIVAMMAETPIEPPILQVLGIRKLPASAGSDRYRLMLSDGVHCINFAMLATQHNHLVESSSLSEFCLVRIDRHITSKIQKENSDRRVLIVLDISVVVPGTGLHKIGNPVLYTDNSGASTTNNNVTKQEPKQEPEPLMNGPPQKMARMETVPKREPLLNAPAAMNGHGEAPQGVITRPISSINPYQAKWIIRARVTAKTPVRKWSNSKGDGSLFSMDLKDESGEIRATAFKEDCEKYFPIIEQNKVYYISHCTVKNANKKFTTIKHDFELTFNRDTTVSPADEEGVPGVEYEFAPIESLAEMPVDTLVDIIGVCKYAGECGAFTARSSGRELKKREIQLVDNTKHSISLTLWGERAEDFDGSGNPVVAVKQAKINEFQSSKGISTTMSSVVTLNPDLPEAHRLRGWYDNGGSDEQFTEISALGAPNANNSGVQGDIISILQSKESQLGFGNAPDYFNAVVNVMSVRRENVYYLSCPTPDCKKKVIDNHNGTYTCEKCGKDFEDCIPRMILSMCVADYSDNLWLTVFDNDGQILLGMDGRELKARKDDGETQFNEVFDKIKFTQLKLRIRAKAEVYNDESRLRTTVAKLELVDVKQDSHRLIREIAKMNAEGVRVTP